MIRLMSEKRRVATIEQRLAAQSEIDPLSGCHIWQGRRNSTGYPVISLQGRLHLVHRLAWTLRYGRIRDGMELCHRCDEPRGVEITGKVRIRPFVPGALPAPRKKAAR